MSMKVKADLELCQGHGVCTEEAPEIFGVVEQKGRYPRVVVVQERPADALRAKVLRAVRYCPTRALALDDE
jgi:ferredoxin